MRRKLFGRGSFRRESEARATSVRSKVHKNQATDQSAGTHQASLPKKSVGNHVEKHDSFSVDVSSWSDWVGGEGQQTLSAREIFIDKYISGGERSETKEGNGHESGLSQE